MFHIIPSQLAANQLGHDAGQLVHWGTDLVQVVTVAQGGGIELYRVEVDGDAERISYFVRPSIPLAHRS